MNIREDWLEATWSMTGWMSIAFCVAGIYLLYALKSDRDKRR